MRLLTQERDDALQDAERRQRQIHELESQISQLSPRTTMVSSGHSNTTSGDEVLQLKAQIETLQKKISEVI